MHLKSLAAALTALIMCGAAALAAAPNSITVPMKAEHDSGETGTATITQMASGLKIVVSIANAPANAQPTHIHPGTCTKLNPAPEYPLSPLENGKSVTTLPGKKLSDLTSGKFSINVHKSADDLPTYVSCGEIK